MWLNGYRFRKKITIDHTKVSTDLSYFPTLIKILNDASVGANALSTGFDLRFTSYDGTTLLDYERESFVIAGGVANAFIWVKIPALSSTSDTVIYMYYGKADAVDGQNTHGVWDDGGSNNFKMVQHMNQDPSGTAPQMLDSTQYANNGTSRGTMTSGDLVTGQIDGATDFDGVDDYVDAGNGSGLNLDDSFTVEIWFKLNPNSLWRGVFSKRNGGGGNPGYGLYFDSSSHPYMAIDDGTFSPNIYVIDKRYDDASWYHLVGVRSKGGTLKIYINGVEKGSTADTTVGSITNSTNALIGSGLNVRKFPGQIDEVRISNTARSASWIATEYANQSSPVTFCEVGTTETLGKIIFGSGSHKVLIDSTSSSSNLKIV